MSVVDLPFDATLDDLEAIVASGIGAFVEVGLALAEIRDRRLYLDSHETFDGYCRERWGMERTYAHRNIEAAQVASMLPMGNRPANERQARELARLEPDEVAEAWGEVVELTDNRPTAEAVRKVVDEALRKQGRAPDGHRLTADELPRPSFRPNPDPNATEVCPRCEGAGKVRVW